tara:strand:- start:3480 stop:3941 length:462 start_codon:yes stop_codon:yes gene_type:complete
VQIVGNSCDSFQRQKKKGIFGDVLHTKLRGAITSFIQMITQKEIEALGSLKISISKLEKLKQEYALKEQIIIDRLLEQEEELEEGAQNFFIRSLTDYIRPSWKKEFKNFINENCPNVEWNLLKRKIVSDTYSKMKPLQTIIFQNATRTDNPEK